MTVTLVWPGGREERLEVGAEPILDAAERADLGLPFGCRTGACGTCTARLLDGEVTYERPPRALKGRHRAEGYALTCVARPATDCRLAVGAHHQAEMVSTPWK